jgi:hypothetical protein
MVSIQRELLFSRNPAKKASNIKNGLHVYNIALL